MDWQQIKNRILKPKAQAESGQASKDTAQANRNKKMAVLMVVLLIVFIFVITRTFKQLSPQTAGAQPRVDSNSIKVNSVTAVVKNEKKVNWQIPQEYPASLCDPMQANPTADGQSGDGNMIVKGIISSKDRPSAVIGDRIMHQGEKTGKITIIKINKNNVEFEMDGKRWTQEVQQ